VTRELRPGEKERILRANEAMAGDASASRLRLPEFDEGVGRPRGDGREAHGLSRLVGMIDPRGTSQGIHQDCRDVKIKPVMITGDHKLTAVAVAREIGIYREGDIALTGDDLDKMSEEDLAEVVDRHHGLRARLPVG